MKTKRIALCTAVALEVNIMSGVSAFSDFDKNHWAYLKKALLMQFQ